jgi:hypothetical protein
MNAAIANGQRRRRAARAGAARAMMVVVGAFIAAAQALAQESPEQDRLALVKMAMAANAQQLHQYQWVETTQVTVNGEAKPSRQNACQYAPDGTVLKSEIGPPPEAPSGGPLMQRIIERKKAEMQEYMAGVKSVLAQYLPPDPQRMELAKQAGNLSVNPVAGAINLVFRNYAQPGDQMTVTFNTVAKKVASVSVNTYMGDSQDAVTLQVQMASLPDGTNYAQQTILNATAKNLVVVTTNSNYQKVGGP